MAEAELAELRKTTVTTDYSVETRCQTLGGVSLPVADDAKKAIADMGNGVHNYVQLKIDTENETILLVRAKNIQLNKLAPEVPNDSPRYHLYNFKHTHEGDFIESIGKNQKLLKVQKLQV